MTRNPSETDADQKRKVAWGGKKTRIFLVDDHPFMRHGLSEFIANQPNLVVCGEADNARDALTAIDRIKPDLVITDIILPGKSGLELTKDIRAMHPEIMILVMSMHDEPYYAERVLHAGARGYLMKREGGTKLVTAIQRVLEGHVYVSESIANRILESFSRGVSDSNGSPVQKLTDRELEVFELIGQARTSREIAESLHISIKTVEAHRANIKEKLNLKGGPELIRLAVRWVESKNSPGAEPAA